MMIKAEGKKKNYHSHETSPRMAAEVLKSLSLDSIHIFKIPAFF